MTDLGDRVQGLREGYGWTVEDLARHAGVPRPWLVMVEQGINDEPSPESLHRLAGALGVTVQYLALGEETPAPAPVSQALARLPAGLADDLQAIARAGQRSEQARRMIGRFATTLRELFLANGG